MSIGYMHIQALAAKYPRIRTPRLVSAITAETRRLHSVSSYTSYIKSRFCLFTEAAITPPNCSLYLPCLCITSLMQLNIWVSDSLRLCPAISICSPKSQITFSRVGLDVKDWKNCTFLDFMYFYIYVCMLASICT